MPKRISGPWDVSQWARQIVEESTGPERVNVTESEISRIMAEMGRRGGKIGGKRRMQTMTPEERSEAASLAARKRWQKCRASND